MTVPRNSWIRSRSPSLILKWTLTVSPGCSSGISGLTAASTALDASLIGTAWLVFSVQSPPPTLGRRTRSLPRSAGRLPEASNGPLRAQRQRAGDSSALAPLGPRNDREVEAGRPGRGVFPAGPPYRP